MPINPQTTLTHIEQRLRLLLSATQLPQAGGILSLTLSMDELPFHGLPDLTEDWLYWAQPESDHYLLGLGIAAQTEATGPERFSTLSAEVSLNQTHTLRLDPDATGTTVKYFLGFAFDPNDLMQDDWQPFPNSALLLPKLLMERHDGHCSFTFNHRIAAQTSHEIITHWLDLAAQLCTALSKGPSRSGRSTPLVRELENPTPAVWQTLVTEALEGIKTQQFDKAVPARYIRVQAERVLNPSRLMAVLDCLYPSCRLLGFNLKGKTLVAATPERLVSLRAGCVTCDAIGGTIDRAAGEAEDAEKGQNLLDSPKTRHEHKLVVQAVSSALQDGCKHIQTPSSPKLLALRNLQHLWTEINAQADNDTHLISLAKQLHPTPAVNGSPGPSAAHWLRNNEPIHRGWFSGAAGWIDSNKEGELSVILRCAILQGKSAGLYAGAGIVADSCPEAELAETELKFGAMLEALENA